MVGFKVGARLRTNYITVLFVGFLDLNFEPETYKRRTSTALRYFGGAQQPQAQGAAQYK